MKDLTENLDFGDYLHYCKPF